MEKKLDYFIFENLGNKYTNLCHKALLKWKFHAACYKPIRIHGYFTYSQWWVGWNSVNYGYDFKFSNYVHCSLGHVCKNFFSSFIADVSSWEVHSNWQKPKDQRNQVGLLR